MTSNNGDLKLLGGGVNGAHGVVIVAEQPAARARFAELLSAEGIEIAARAVTLRRVTALCARDPGLVVVLGCPMADAPEAVRTLRRAAAETRIVLVTEEPSEGRVLRAAVRAQVEAVVYGGQLDDALAPSVRAVFAEQLVFPRAERRRVENPVLSHRERQVLRLAVQGRTNDEIASRLYLATSTVKGHLTSAFAKLAVRSRSEAAALIFDPDEPIGQALLAGSTEELEAPPWR